MSGNFPFSQIIVLMCNLWSDFIDVRDEQLPNFQVTTASQENKTRNYSKKEHLPPDTYTYLYLTSFKCIINYIEIILFSNYIYPMFLTVIWHSRDKKVMQ